MPFDGPPPEAAEDMEDLFSTGIEGTGDDEPSTTEVPAPAALSDGQAAIDDALAPPTQTEPGSEPTTPVEGEQTTEPVAAEPVTWAGRQYPSMEAAEKASRDAQAKLLRDAQRANAAEARARELEAFVLQQQQQQGPPAQIDPNVLMQLGLDPEAAPALQQMIEEAAARRVAPIEGQLRAQREAEARAAAHAAVQQNVAAYRANHPDHAEVESEVVSLLLDLEVIEPAVDPRTGQPIIDPNTGQQALTFIGANDPAWFEIAHEAAKRPALARVLRGQPELSETDDGMETARLLAQQHEARAALAAQGPSTTAPAGPAADAAVLTGPANTPAGGANQPADAVDQILADDRAARRSVFVGG